MTKINKISTQMCIFKDTCAEKLSIQRRKVFLHHQKFKFIKLLYIIENRMKIVSQVIENNLTEVKWKIEVSV